MNMGLIIVISFLFEVGLLVYMECKAWNSLFTPLNMLMLPYAAVLLVSVFISGHFGFVQMHYPSVMIWSVALLIFAIPSQYLAFTLHKKGKPYKTALEVNDIPDFIPWLSLCVCLLLFYKLKQTIAHCPFQIGTNEFGEAFDHNGLWAHISRLNSLLLMIMVYYVDKKHRYIWVIILLQLVLLFIHKVKGWIFVPIIAGMIMRLYAGRSKLTFSFFFLTILSVIAVFFVIYIVSLVVGQNVEFGGKLVGFIFRHIVHYLTSGVLGLSEDMLNGFPDRGAFEMNIAQFVNLAKVFTGDQDYISTINPLFYHTGFNFTNVRTLFGTIYINSNPISFVLTVFVLSSIIHLFKVLSLKFNSLYVNLILFYFCALLFMGWFDTFFSQLAVVEVPVLILMLWLADRLLKKRV